MAETKFLNKKEISLKESDQTEPALVDNSNTLANLASARENPKFQRMVQHIETLLERTKGARHEMERMIQITKELRDQCALQEQECVALEVDQTKVKEEINGLTGRLKTLMSDKISTEQKLEELRLENIKLDAFLQQAQDSSLDD
ncbi:hypothetical protein BATDEDRAFT_23536 [Batrachochytrium dendrobatidis JAM81]|uniref:Uncharacterized protein n=2 Tax=Batrachochytrium dendrobatidis TaxID=109871 RepID=F4NXL4_BATDJ|nr:uncharacterized protein BATDEDRAFT_23536 [Batrachochytrium dendrobatidis JAM81]EGF81865.1 hypothetical protein BATDEDRAFT_23536 [Batrachochytrium dendrobatidis JAM81]KAJ8324589.1 hypothetical protein O5D80_006834 [Batrachochytrium dendrobatidis]KAK5670838.1 hypothetical protein QVD99_002607 [Batrachochytrium dendrobatidis]OAJ40484.1 hypothetical protein BDEG_24214 [Batrachochytrium dendrobatidis JEL423]|eukprot:XP_006677308.1 hypothetical protein BATDEDRAFT_23536 [Batrachochytrium dendrobatidis JAM81]